MSERVHFYDPRYTPQLRELREAALENSLQFGQRLQLGKLTFGTVHAHWYTEDGHPVSLVDSCPRYDDRNAVPITNPTKLTTLSDRGKTGILMTVFEMDIDNSSGLYNVYRSILSLSPSFREEVSRQRMKRKSDNMLLSSMTPEDGEFLYKEMERGASGMFTTNPEEI